MVNRILNFWSKIKVPKSLLFKCLLNKKEYSVHTNSKKQLRSAVQALAGTPTSIKNPLMIVKIINGKNLLT